MAYWSSARVVVDRILAQSTAAADTWARRPSRYDWCLGGGSKQLSPGGRGSGCCGCGSGGGGLRQIEQICKAQSAYVANLSLNRNDCWRRRSMGFGSFDMDGDGRGEGGTIGRGPRSRLSSQASLAPLVVGWWPGSEVLHQRTTRASERANCS